MGMNMASSFFLLFPFFPPPFLYPFRRVRSLKGSSVDWTSSERLRRPRFPVPIPFPLFFFSVRSPR